jgi:phosphotriesterase-related protein
MTQITTVSGPIAPGDLGFTSMHEHTVSDAGFCHRRYEHLIPADAPVAADDPVKLDNLAILKHAHILSKDALDMRDEGLIESELMNFAASGGRAVVDMSTPGLRCNIPALKRISRKTGVRIIASTGLYAEDSWPERFRDMDMGDYMKYMWAEIENSIEGTGIRAGHIKVAITDTGIFNAQPFSDQQKKLLRAAVRVSNETGIALSVHPPLDAVENVRNVVKVMLDEGINPGKAVIAHSDLFFVPRDLKLLITDPGSWKLNTDFARELLGKGFNISIDSFGHFQDGEPIGIAAVTDWQRLGGLVSLIKAGYSSQIVLGTDVYLKILTRRYGGEGYCRLTDFVIPSLRQAGIDEFDIQKMTVDNPARILSH